MLGHSYIDVSDQGRVSFLASLSKQDDIYFVLLTIQVFAACAYFIEQEIAAETEIDKQGNHSFHSSLPLLPAVRCQR